MRIMLGLLLALAVAMPSVASAKAHHRHHPRCGANMVLRHVVVRKHKHGRLVKVHKTVCVRVHRPAGHAIAPQPLAPAPKTVKLHAHLDPTFTRDPSNPFKVTYAYSASATSETVGAPLAAEPTSLPEGILQLYNDGVLACSINVGGTTSGGECPVTYSKLGEHTVTTVYQSGSTSATETEVEHIEPIKVTVTLEASYQPLATSSNEAGLSGYEACAVEPTFLACVPITVNEHAGQPYRQCREEGVSSSCEPRSRHEWEEEVVRECQAAPTLPACEYWAHNGLDFESSWLVGHLLIAAAATDEQGHALHAPFVSLQGIGSQCSLTESETPVSLALWGITPARTVSDTSEPVVVPGHDNTCALPSEGQAEVHASWGAQSGYVNSEVTLPVSIPAVVHWP